MTFKRNITLLHYLSFVLACGVERAAEHRMNAVNYENGRYKGNLTGYLLLDIVVKQKLILWHIARFGHTFRR